jgi:lipopolysaccharide export system protein LptA
MLLVLLWTGVMSRSAWGEDRPTKDSRVEPEGIFGSLSFTSGREPITVTSDGLEFDYKRRVLTYRGRVKATQGDMKLEADSLTIYLAEGAGSELREVVARGNVRLTKGERWATGGEAVFDQTRRTAVLSKNAVLHDGPSQVVGERVVVYLDEERSVVEGGSGGRVTAVLVPPASDGNVAAPTPASQPQATPP